MIDFWQIKGVVGFTYGVIASDCLGGILPSHQWADLCQGKMTRNVPTEMSARHESFSSTKASYLKIAMECASALLRTKQIDWTKAVGKWPLQT